MQSLSAITSNKPEPVPLRFEVWVVVGHDGGERVGAFRDAIGLVEVTAEPDKVVPAALTVASYALGASEPDECDIKDRTAVLITDTLGPRLFEFTQYGGAVLQFRRVGE